MSAAPETVAHSLTVAEGLRWRGDFLWFSDIHDSSVKRLDSRSGAVEIVATIPGRPCGLSWDSDGCLLIVEMQARQVLRVGSDGAVAVFAALDVDSDANDMVADTSGRHRFVGTIGFDLFAGETPRSGEIVRIDDDGSSAVVAGDIGFANGMVITPDGRTLIVAESFGGRLTAFDIDEDGALTGRRVWAALAATPPDGICLDVEGCVWVASPLTAEVLRVAEGDEVIERVEVADGSAVTCTLGGADRRTLFISVAHTVDPEESRVGRDARIDAIEVAVPGSGSP